MATELGQAYVQIMPSAKGISGKITKAIGPETTSAGKIAGGNIVSSIKKIIVAAGIGKTLAATIKEGGALEQSIGGVETLFKDHADTVRKHANEAYKTVGVSANNYMENVTSFSASLLQSLGGDTKEAARVAHVAMVDMGDNANKMGTDMRDIQNAYQGFAKQNYTMLDNLKLGYGGTKTEMERLLRDAQKLTGVKYNINNLADVYEAVHAIQEEIGITGTTALEAEETILGSFNAMKSAFKNTLGALAIGENVKGSFKALADTTATFLFDNLIPMIGEIFKNLPTGIATLIKEGAPQFIEAGKELLNSLMSGVSEGLPAMMQEGVSFASEFARGIFDGLPGVINSIGEILDGILTAIFEAAPPVLSSGIELIGSLAQGIWDNLPAIVKSITNVLGKLLDAIIKYLPGFLQKGVELIGKLAQGIWNNLPQIITTMGNLLVRLIGAIRQRLPEFLQKGIELIAKLALGIIKAIPGVVAKIPQVISALIRTFGSLVGQFAGIGGDIIRGLWRGISSVKNWILGKIKGFVGSITKGIKSFFGISSPSKVMADEVGKWLPVGLAEGIEEHTTPVTRAMEDLASLTTGSLESELALNATSSGPQSNIETNTRNKELKDLYDVIVKALTDGTRIEWNDRELGRLVRQFA